MTRQIVGKFQQEVSEIRFALLPQIFATGLEFTGRSAEDIPGLRSDRGLRAGKLRPEADPFFHLPHPALPHKCVSAKKLARPVNRRKFLQS